jgi:hypothetical protein
MVQLFAMISEKKYTSVVTRHVPKPSWVRLQRRKQVEEESNGSVPFCNRATQVRFLTVADSAEDNSDLFTASDVNPTLENG